MDARMNSGKIKKKKKIKKGTFKKNCFSDKFPQNTFIDLTLASLAFLKHPLSKKALQGIHVLVLFTTYNPQPEQSCLFLACHFG